jgi:hypothetical protein
VRKPGAFAQYRYHDALFPSLVFRRAYDALRQQQPQRADQQYVRLLHLAATTSESEVETALSLLLDAGTLPTHDTVRDLVRGQPMAAVPQLTPAPRNDNRPGGNDNHTDGEANADTPHDHNDGRTDDDGTDIRRSRSEGGKPASLIVVRQQF